MDETERNAIFWQLLDYYFYDPRDMTDEERDDDSLYETHLQKRFPLITQLDVYLNWKGLFIEITNHANADQIAYPQRLVS